MSESFLNYPKSRKNTFHSFSIFPFTKLCLSCKNYPHKLHWNIQIHSSLSLFLSVLHPLALKIAFHCVAILAEFFASYWREKTGYISFPYFWSGGMRAARAAWNWKYSCPHDSHSARRERLPQERYTLYERLSRRKSRAEKQEGHYSELLLIAF